MNKNYSYLVCVALNSAAIIAVCTYHKIDYEAEMKETTIHQDLNPEAG